jgi:pimeloyl-ACP methyl ester carboxylesterase
MNYPLYSYCPGTEGKPALLLGHANGFPPPVYAPLITALGGDYHAVCLPARPLWEGSDPAQMQDWLLLTADFIGGITQHRLAPVIAIGHSMSGVALLMAAVQQPDLFRALILIDPVLLPRPFLRITRVLKTLRLKWDGRLVQGALRRRRTWPSQAAAYQNFRERSLFARCSDDMVRLYTQSITRPTPNGVELVYSPAWEAQIYRSIQLDSWTYPPRVRVPCLLLYGATTNTFLPASARLWAKQRPDLPLIKVNDAGHLLPLEHPDQVAEHIRTFIAKLAT